ncbi:hypothetical protein HFO55_34390 [Rhizobium leguminosarum]|uniref:hypothetical protein n=1 Tax=Rhizobium leguminosarum TaxID=384 RepID=UPI001C959195|nr:hypothetical protein [Rhizobium leguminosarum]MBY5572189.1 hypothetical protein [Rhizobium leguminosarum]MBY5578794.1 hypothetical protein [Rhizobium leguminosarum]
MAKLCLQKAFRLLNNINNRHEETTLALNREWLAAAAEMIQTRVDEGFEPSMLTLMFKDMKGSEASRRRLMTNVATDIYSDLLPRLIKRIKSKTLMELPFFLGCVDWPVPKKHFKALDGIHHNDGMHFGGLYLVPPKARTASNLMDIVERSRPVLMRSGLLTAIHVEPVLFSPEKATRYVLKSLERFRIGNEEVLVLPRSRSEM